MIKKIVVISDLCFSSAFAFVGHVAFRASPSEKMQRSLQLPLEPLVILNVRFIFMFILLSILIFIFIEVSGNLQCQIYLECPSMLFQVFNKYITRYGLLILGLQAFIVYKCVTRFLTYISLPWPQVTMNEFVRNINVCDFKRIART